MRNLHHAAVHIAPLRRPFQAGGAGIDDIVVIKRRCALVVTRLQTVVTQARIDAVNTRLVAKVHAGRAVGIAILIRVGRVFIARIHIPATAAFISQIDGVCQAVAATRQAGCCLAAAIAAEAQFCIRQRRAIHALAGKNLHHTAHGVRAINGSSRASQHFNALNLCQRQRGPVGTALHLLAAITHTVHKHQRVLVVHAAQVHASGLAGAAIAVDLHAGHTG